MNIQWNQYTWYSKLGAIILFILILPTLTFYIGVQYEKTVEALNGVNTPTVQIVQTHKSVQPLVTVPEPTITTTTTTTTATSTKQLHITALMPAKGPTQTVVTIKGSGFDLNDNLILFGTSKGSHHRDGTPDNAIAHASSTDGTTLTFTVPTSGPSGIICSPTNQCIAISAMRMLPGTYPVSVSNKNGTSSSLNFTVTQ